MARRPSIGLSGTISQPVGPGNVTLNPLTQTIGANTNVPLVQGEDVSVNVGVSGGLSPRGPTGSFTPTVQFGQGQGAAGGAALGGALGPFIAGPGPIGSAIGSGIGSLVGGAFGGNSPHRKEHNARNSFINKLREIGVIDANYQFMFPDGSVGTFDGGSGSMHGAKDPSRLVGEKRDQLFGFESDYTNDLDYVAAMGGITLARMLGGGKDKSVDQVGNLMGNQALGKLGYGQDFNPDNFNAVADNLRSLYAKSGIKSKEEFLSLANEAFAQSRFNDADRAVAQQVASLIYDKDFGKASALMSGRDKGLEVAAKTPEGGGGKGPRKGTIFTGRDTGIKGGVYAPIISFEEAMQSVQPAVDYYQQAVGKGPQRSSLQEFVGNLQGATSIVQGVGGLYQALDKLSSGGISDFLSETFGFGGEVAPPDVFGTEDIFGVGSISEDFGLGDTSDFLNSTLAF